VRHRAPVLLESRDDLAQERDVAGEVLAEAVQVDGLGFVELATFAPLVDLQRADEADEHDEQFCRQ
jgi:hypothetical protein